jgi:hypothetical protein
MKTAFALVAMAGSAMAFPILDDPQISQTARALWEHFARRDLSQDPLGISKAQTNCG